MEDTVTDKAERVAKAMQTGDWTVSALHDHLETVLYLMEQRNADRFTAMEKTSDAALAAAVKAVEKAEHLADVRAAAQNEWRGTVSDILAQSKGKTAGVSTTVAYIFAGIAAAVSLISLYIATACGS